MALARIRLVIKELTKEFAAFRLATVSQDLRYSIRHLARNPSFYNRGTHSGAGHQRL